MNITLRNTHEHAGESHLCLCAHLCSLLLQLYSTDPNEVLYLWVVLFLYTVATCHFDLISSVTVRVGEITFNSKRTAVTASVTEITYVHRRLSQVASSPGSPSSAICMTFDPPEEKRRESLVMVYLGT